MKKSILTMLLIMISGLNLFAQKKAEKLKVCITEEEYEIYKLIGVVNYQNETSGVVPSSTFIDTELPGISPETVTDFKEKNSKVYLLRCLNKTDGKEKGLPRSYGNDASFSRIGFSRDGKEALVHHSWSAIGNQCWSGYYLLRRNVEKWEIVKRATMVIC